MLSPQVQEPAPEQVLHPEPENQLTPQLEWHGPWHSLLQHEHLQVLESHLPVEHEYQSKLQLKHQGEDEAEEHVLRGGSNSSREHEHVHGWHDQGQPILNAFSFSDQNSGFAWVFI